MKPKNHTKRLLPRIWAMVGFCAVVMIVFILQLVNLQLVNGEYYLGLSQNTKTYRFGIEAARGEIVDKNGRSIATNVTTHKVELSKGMMTGDLNDTLKNLVEILQASGEGWNDTLPITTQMPFEFTVDLTADSSANAALARQQNKLRKLKTDFGKQAYATADEVLESMVEKYELAEYDPQWQRILAGIRYQMELDGFGEMYNFTLATDVSMKTVSTIKEHSLILTGVEISESSQRVYPDSSLLANVIGSIGPIYAEDWADPSYKKEMQDKGYEMNSLIGHGGLEEALENALRGKDGIKMVEYGKDGTIHNSWVQKEPAPGKTAVLTIDGEFQKQVSSLLANYIQTMQTHAPGKGRECNSGAVVVLNTKTGGVLALSTYPTYTSDQLRNDFETLANDPNSPLLNRATQQAYMPGSIFKPVVGLKGMLDGIMAPSSTVNCVRQYNLISGMNPPSCLSSHGPISIHRALEQSCNWYFYDVGRRLGIDNFGEFSKRLGLGTKTGLEIGEVEGHITSSADPDYTYGYVLMSAIGQQNTKISPVQMATYAATIANKGVRYRTHMVAGYRDSNTGELLESFDAQVEDTIEDNVGAFDAVTQGMIQMAQNNSAALRGYPITVAAKTGTPERGITNEYGIDLYHGTSILFAPAEDPEIAIAIVLENAGSGASTLYLARSILDAYFFGENGSTAPQQAGVLLE